MELNNNHSITSGCSNSFTSLTGTKDSMCPICGKPYFYVGDVMDWLPGTEPFCTGHRDHNCLSKYIFTKDNSIETEKYGWICPRCKKVNAPWVNQCPCQPSECNE